MFEKVNPSHPDKLADRIAGAMVDMAYEAGENPRIAVEVLIGHGNCFVIYESSVCLDDERIKDEVRRITGDERLYYDIDYNEQDSHLSDNQSGAIRCGDNGIFKGVPVTREQSLLSSTMRDLYESLPYDGKAVAHDKKVTICQSNVTYPETLTPFLQWYDEATVNPIGPWTGGPDVDTGATNRKLGSDMGDAVTGGGLHGKDLSKADVSVNVTCHLLAQKTMQTVTATCAIGDESVTFEFEDGHGEAYGYGDVVEFARDYVSGLGGFERLAEWGLV